MELLEINSSELVEKFDERIEDKFDFLLGEMEEGFDVRAEEEGEDATESL